MTLKPSAARGTWAFGEVISFLNYLTLVPQAKKNIFGGIISIQVNLTLVLKGQIRSALGEIISLELADLTLVKGK